MSDCNRYGRTFYRCNEFNVPSQTRTLYNNNNCQNQRGHNLRFVNIPQIRTDFGFPFYNLNN